MKSFIITLITALIAVVAVTVLLPGPERTAEAAQADRVARGKYLVDTIGCGDCHSPKVFTPEGEMEFDMERHLSGHPGGPLPPAGTLGGPWIAATNEHSTAWSGPWGVSFAMNLTPDENTGIGIWTEEMFVKTIKTGRHMGVSRPVLPPMPWQVYRNLTEDDLKAIYAYLRTLKPVHNRIPDPIPPPEMASAPSEEIPKSGA